MKQNRRILHYSMLGALICVTVVPATAAVKITNTSRPNRASMYQQINNQPQSAHVNDAAPVMADSAVDTDARLSNAGMVAASAIPSSDASAVNRLQACQGIYPNGEFELSTPNMGMAPRSTSTCVAVVELRGYQMGENGSDVVLARANVAAGDSFKCNISDFPRSSYTAAADSSRFIFPNDKEPTIDDVIAVMNQEQKQNAGFKIAASVLVGGLGGNIAGDNEVGKTGLLGGGKDKTKSTIIGALGAGAVTTASIYSGKVAGDTIMSAGINAAAGGVVGNIMAVGDSVLRIEDCNLPDGSSSTCLWGVLQKSIPINKDKYYFVNIGDVSNTTYECDQEKVDGGSTDNGITCRPVRLIAIKLNYTGADGVSHSNVSISDIKDTDFAALRTNSANIYALIEDAEKPGSQKMVKGGNTENGNGVFVKIASAGFPDKSIPAVIAGITDKPFGLKKTEWNKRDKSMYADSLYGRTTSGDAFVITQEKDTKTGQLKEQYSIDEFYPMLVDADDGGIIDLGNKARLKATLTGVGVGGALGAYSGYQGAQDEVSARWVSAVREYKDSLQKVVCMTGNRFLGFYNDTIVIPSATNE